jgi:uncharacterized protein (TIGR03083 family)
MHLVEVYHTSRTRLIAQAANLTEAQQNVQVPATPLWSVADVYRHLTGVPSDVFSGRLEGGGTPEWTAFQVSSRADRSLAEVCAEWEENAEKFEQMIHESGFGMAKPCLDVWTHEQDVRNALGLEPNTSDAAVPTLVVTVLAILRERWKADPELPGIDFVVDGTSHVLGEGEPELSLRITGYEFLRSIVGRRSKAQVLAADWSGSNPERILPALCIQPLPEHDLAV